MPSKLQKSEKLSKRQSAHYTLDLFSCQEQIICLSPTGKPIIQGGKPVKRCARYRPATFPQPNRNLTVGRGCPIVPISTANADPAREIKPDTGRAKGILSPKDKRSLTPNRCGGSDLINRRAREFPPSLWANLWSESLMVIGTVGHWYVTSEGVAEGLNRPPINLAPIHQRPKSKLKPSRDWP